MPDWFAVTGAITNVATAMDLGYRYRPTEAIYGKDAGDILKEVDDILKSSSAVLENHKDVLDEDMYEGLWDQYRTYHWQMADESQGHRAIRDQIIRQSRILSQLYASEDSRQGRAESLLATVEQYQTDVLAMSQAASQARRGKTLALFPDIKNPTSAATSPRKSYSSWFSVFGGSSRNASQSDIESTGSSEAPSLSSSVALSPLETSLTADGEPYIVAVTYLPDTDATSAASAGSGATETPTSGEPLYRRMVSFEGAGRRIDVIDPRPRVMGENMARMDEKSLRAMSQLGERLLNQRGGAVPSGSRMIKAPIPSVSLESAIESFKKMSTSTS